MKAEYDFSRARRGAVAPAASGKTRITIRLDADVIDTLDLTGALVDLCDLGIAKIALDGQLL